MNHDVLKRAYEARVRDIEAQMARGRTPNRLRQDLQVARTIVSLCEDLEASQAALARATALLEYHTDKACDEYDIGVIADEAEEGVD